MILVGRIVRDPEIRYSQGEKSTAIAKFSLAVERKFKQEGQPTADFINCIAFGKKAEVLEKYCKQGTKIVVEGSWQTGSYTNRDGSKVYTNDCMVENLEFAESKGSGKTNSNGNSNPAPKSSGDGFMKIPDGAEDGEFPFN